MKMVHQVLAGIHILGASEAMGFAAQLGLDAHKTADAIKSGNSWSWMHENRLQRMLEEDWHPGASALTIILKDVVSIIVSLSLNTIANARNRESSLLLPARTSSPPPLCSTAEQVYLSALLQGYGAVDDSSMVRQYYSQALTKVSSTKSTEETADAQQLVLDLMELTNLVAGCRGDRLC